MTSETENIYKMEIEGENYVFPCPHCLLWIQVKTTETNCCIFRHGVLKENMTQISPHAPKEECDRLFEENRIFGCGKPFRIFLDEKLVRICEYI